MIQCAVLCLASVILHLTNPEWTDFGTKFGGLSSLLCWCLKWSLSLWTLFELNWTLNRWADRRWSFTVDKSGWDWKCEVAVVTGGSGGIGAAIVKKLVFHGIKVAVLDVSPLSDIFTEDELALIRFYKCDITSPDSIHQAAEAIRSDLGHPSILINNAGIGNAWNILDVTYERLQSLFNINLLSHWCTVQEFLPDMLAKKKGHILGIGSLSAYVALAGAVDYSCAKAGVQAFYEGLTAELKHRYKCPQIQTSCIHPNWTKSAMTSHGAISGGLKNIGVRLMEAEYVAEIVVNQIISVRSGHIAIGPSLTTKFRSLPTWLQEFVRDDQSRAVVGTGSTRNE